MVIILQIHSFIDVQAYNTVFWVFFFFLPFVCLFWKNIFSVPVSILNRIVWGFFFAIEGYDAVYFLFLSLTLFFFNVYFYLFIWLHQLFVVAHRIFDLCCDMWDFFFLLFFLVMTCELSYRL